MSPPGRPVLHVISGQRSSIHPNRASYTIADVAEACGLPQPVIAQLAPRTWTAAGWMYTAAQVQVAIEIAEGMRATRDGQ